VTYAPGTSVAAAVEAAAAAAAAATALLLMLLMILREGHLEMVQSLGTQISNSQVGGDLEHSDEIEEQPLG
jgi:hypothetical protein